MARVPVRIIVTETQEKAEQALGELKAGADFAAVAKHGVKGEGSAAAANKTVLTELAELLAEGKLEIPIARVYPLEQVREAYQELASGHTHGKIVLIP